MATLLQLKADLEDKRGTRMRMVFSGATEAHLLAEEIGMPLVPFHPLNEKLIQNAAQAKVGVILTSVRPFPGNWDNRRMYVAHSVTCAIGCVLRTATLV